MPRHLVAAAGLLLLGLAAAAQQPAASRVANADDARRRLGLLPDYAAVPTLKDVKVAVLDSGFAGVGAARPYLPKSAVVVEHYDADFVRRFDLGDPAFTRPFAPGDAHGRLMAQLVWATTGGPPDGPQFYLLNANGPTLFRRAVRYAVEQKVDVILFSGTFEGAGNYDGRGPINAVVDEALAAGIVWVNAAGNAGHMVYNGPVEIGPDGWLRLDTGTGLRFTNRFDENAVTVTLTWNDYRDAEDAGTDKDLDLTVEDAAGKVVGEGKLTQVPAGPPAAAGQSKNPRERVVLADLPAGTDYRVRVKWKAGAFGPRDRVRVLLSAAKSAPFPDPDTGKLTDPVEFTDATAGGEIYPPADHPGVLTVGDPSRASAIGPTADGRMKPDVVLGSSLARFTSGEETAGSSNAAAYFAGVVVALRAKEPALTAAHVREWVRRLDRKPAPAEVTQAVVPAAPAVPLPPPAPVSPNQLRAMKYAEYATQDSRRLSGSAPFVQVSGPGGVYQVYPGGRATPAGPYPPAPTAGPTVVESRTPATRPDADTLHVPWVTPTPRELADLVRGR